MPVRMQLSFERRAPAMQSTVKVHSTILPGHRIELAVPELPEGAEVDLTVALSQTVEKSADNTRRNIYLWDYLENLPPLTADRKDLARNGICRTQRRKQS